MRKYLSFITFLAMVLLPAQQLLAASKVALVIGNSDYSSVSPLDNPVPDAELIAGKLQTVGFDVTLITDSTLDELRRGISTFGKQLRAGGKDTIGLFYFAGHGVQSFGSNYLLPVDTELNDAADLDLVALEASSIMRQMFSAKNQTNIVILDACRNNPFDHIPDFGDNGLAEMKAPTGTFLAYATAPGNVALDGEGNNSPFTAALANAMTKPGLPIEQLFKQVRISVLEQTGGQQTPWDTSSLTSQFYFKEPIILSDAELAEQRMWESAKISGDMLQIMLFLRTHPGGKFESEAQLLLAQKVAEMQGSNSGDLTAQRSAENAKEATPETQNPGDNEQALINKAQSSGALEDYQAYAAAYPNGVFVELANTEIETMLAKQTTKHVEDEDAGEKPEPAIEVASVEPASTSAVSASAALTFQSPVTNGAEEIVGKTLAELVQGSPLYAPIEGLPESVWAKKSCDSCHQWTKQALCTQAKVYNTEKGVSALTKKHPYGGTFKENLQGWAAAGCL